jgi:hypothetical protein
MTVVDWIAYRATFDLREEPGALAGHAGSVRGALSNERSYRDPKSPPKAVP